MAWCAGEWMEGFDQERERPVNNGWPREEQDDGVEVSMGTGERFA